MLLKIHSQARGRGDVTCRARTIADRMKACRADFSNALQSIAEIATEEGASIDIAVADYKNAIDRRGREARLCIDTSASDRS